MNSPILPISGPFGPASPRPSTTTGAADVAPFRAALAASGRAIAIEASRGGPPPEVLEEITRAGRIHDQLRVSGHELRFSAAAQDRRAEIELADSAGNHVRTLSVAEALDIAAGKPLR
jgi:hypothetical protein